MGDFSTISKSSGALVTLDDFVLSMKFSSSVFTSGVLMFVSELVPFPFMEFLTSEKSAS